MQAFLDAISAYIQNLSEGFQMLMTALISIIPVIELRGAIPIAAHANLAWYLALPAAVVGNMIPVPFILLFIRKIFAFMKKRMPGLRGLVERMERRAAKNMDRVVRYEMLGLFILVAIPLPGTGAWTGALVAALMDLRMKNAVPAILLGVIAAGIVMTLISYGIFSLV